MRLPTASWPSTTTGFSTIAPTARIAPSGGLMMAENSSTGNIPRLETENVAPGQLRASELARPRPLDQVLRLGGDLEQGLLVAVAEHRRDEPVVQGHRDADVDGPVAPDRGAAEARVDPRVLARRQRAGADDEVGERDAWGARERLDLLAQRRPPAPWRSRW